MFLILFMIVLFFIMIASQPSVYVTPIPNTDCAHVEIVRMDILRKIDPEFPVFVVLDTEMCEGENIQLYGDPITIEEQ